MEDVAAHAGGGGLWLVNEWEEYAKYFMREIKVNPAFEAISPKPAELRNPRPIFGRYYDLDELTLPYVQSFPGHHQAPLALGQPPAGVLRARLLERLLRGVAAPSASCG